MTVDTATVTRPLQECSLKEQQQQQPQEEEEEEEEEEEKGGTQSDECAPLNRSEIPIFFQIEE